MNEKRSFFGKNIFTKSFRVAALIAVVVTLVGTVLVADDYNGLLPPLTFFAKGALFILFLFGFSEVIELLAQIAENTRK